MFETTTSPAWTNMLAQFGLESPVLPQNAPVSASKRSVIHDNSPGLDDLFEAVFENE